MKNALHDPVYFMPEKVGRHIRYFKDSPSAPPAPNYAAAAQAQGAANLETAQAQGRMNNPNINTPYGSQTVQWGTPTFNQAGYDAAMAKYNAGGNPSPMPQQSDPRFNTMFDQQAGLANQFDPAAFNAAMAEWQSNQGMQGPPPTRDQFTSYSDPNQATITQTLAPAQQNLLDSQNRISQSLANIGERGLTTVGNTLNQPFDYGSVQDTQNQAYGALTSRLDPQWQMAQQQQETALRNQGLVPGMEAYDNAMRVFNQGKNDAYQQAMLGAIQTAPQTFQLASSLRSQPLNELNALRTGAQVTNPQFSQFNPTSIGQTPLMQGALAQGQAGQNAYNAQVGANNAFTSGLMGLGATAAGSYFGGPMGGALAGRFANGLVS